MCASERVGAESRSWDDDAAAAAATAVVVVVVVVVAASNSTSTSATYAAACVPLLPPTQERLNHDWSYDYRCHRHRSHWVRRAIVAAHEKSN
jgi:hypothetical protein